MALTGHEQRPVVRCEALVHRREVTEREPLDRASFHVLNPDPLVGFRYGNVP